MFNKDPKGGRTVYVLLRDRFDEPLKAAEVVFSIARRSIGKVFTGSGVKAAGDRDQSTTKLYDRRGYNPEKTASFFVTY